MTSNSPQFTRISLALMFLFLISSSLPGASDISVSPSSIRLQKFETLYLKIDLSRPFRNPYDPDDIRVDAMIASPSGTILTLPCFYKSGSSARSEWEARFTPMQTGEYSYHIRLMNGKKTYNSKTFEFKTEESTRDGFLRLNPGSMYSFRFDSGKLYRGVGMNLGWELQTEWKYSYETYFDELQKNHADFIRTWMCPWNLPLEWTRVNQYDSFTDELENWDRTFSHTAGMVLAAGKTAFAEDDTNRVTIQSSAGQTLVYHLYDMRRFKIKLFYHKHLSAEKIKCSYSKDNISYNPLNIEFGQSWYTKDDWYRMFIAHIADLPDGVNYFKIEFLEDLEGFPQIANVLIEHGPPRDILDAPGLGRYYEKAALRLDEIIRLAEEKGIYVMLTHDYHGVFKGYIDSWGSNADWRTNPYNVANGGPCRNAEEFFTNELAKKYYKKRLRYMVARWGYSTHLACWEFWNEIDNIIEPQKVSPAAIAAWHKEMADYLKQIDPYKHLVSSSVTYKEIAGLWEIEDLDFTQHHNYGPTANLRESVFRYIKRFHKPDVVGEFALGWKGPDKDYPKELYEGEMHNGLWRGMFSPTPILPLTWWWEWHFYKKQYFHFKAAADFVSVMLKNLESEPQEVAVNSVVPNLEIMAVRVGEQIFVWLRNGSKETINSLTLKVQGVGNSKYLVKTFDTWTGTFSDDMETAIADGKFILKDVNLKSEGDMALWIRSSGQ